MPTDRFKIYDRLEIALMRAGLSHTRERRMMFDYIRLNPDNCARELCEALSSQIGKTTIYRNLHLMAQAGIIERRLDGGWQASDVFEQHVHRCVCRQCGFEIRFWNEKLEKAIDAYIPGDHFAIEDHTLEFRGLCRVCRHSSDVVVRPKIGLRLRKKSAPIPK